MNLPNNRINVKIVDIPTADNIKIIIADMTLVISKVDVDKYNDLKKSNKKKILYKDVHDIILESVSKVFFNDVKFEAMIQALKNPKNLPVLLDWKIEVSDSNQKGFLNILNYKFHNTQPRYQDKRRVERMLKELKYFLADSVKRSKKSKEEVKKTEEDKILSRIVDESKGQKDLIPINIGTGNIFIKKESFFKSKHVKKLDDDNFQRIILLLSGINIHDLDKIDNDNKLIKKNVYKARIV